MSRLVMRCLALVFFGLLVTDAARAQAPAVPPGCAVDSSVVVCVTSAALTFTREYDPNQSRYHLDVSITLRIANATDYPVGIGVLEDDFAFTPQNADTITPYSPRVYGATVSGVQECDSRTDCEFTTIAPGRAALIQVRFTGEDMVNAPGLSLMQIARTASFSASLFVNERGTARLVSVPLEGFAFGNGLTRGR
jgi:hypothetical protein